MKPKVITTGFGGPCIICGKYISVGYGSTLTKPMEEHHIKEHGGVPVTKVKGKVVETIEMFDRKAYLRQ